MSVAAVLSAVALLLMMLVGGGSKPATAAEPVPLTCATYELLYNGKLAKLKFPKGIYAITILNKEKAVCSYAQLMFETFLQDVKNKIEKPWIVKQTSEGEGEEKIVTTTFKRGKKSKVAFTVIPTVAANVPPPEPITQVKACKGKYSLGGKSLTYKKNIGNGKFTFPKGTYRLTPINPKKFNCGKSARKLKAYVKRGRVPNSWKIQPSKATLFKKSDRRSGFFVTRNYAGAAE